jgi:hypothetical protein
MNDILTSILTDPNVSDDLKFVLQGNVAQQDDTPMRRARYVAALQRFDFQFEFSDDHAFWKRCRDELQRLRIVREEVDKDHALWRRHAPAEYRFG